jgi:hypothetical protein
VKARDEERNAGLEPRRMRNGQETKHPLNAANGKESAHMDHASHAAR